VGALAGPINAAEKSKSDIDQLEREIEAKARGV